MIHDLILDAARIRQPAASEYTPFCAFTLRWLPGDEMLSRVLILILLITSPAAIAQSCAATPQDEYFCDLQIVIEEIRAVGWIEEVCSEKYPHTTAANKTALKSWESRYGTFISEMEGQFRTVESYWETNPRNPAKNARTVKQIEANLQESKLRFEQKATSEEAETLRRICEAYPQFLLTPAMNLETARFQFVVVVRRGLP